MNRLPKFATLDTVGSCLTRSSRRYPNKIALISGEQQITYREFNETVNRFSNAIMKLGFKKGDTITLMSSNNVEFLYIWYGLAKAGIIMVPINLMLKGKEVTYIVNHSKSKAFIIEEKFVGSIDNVMGDIQGVEKYICINSKGHKNIYAGMIDFYGLLAQESSIEEPIVEIDGEDLAQIGYTSGTESLPKGAMQTHRGLISHYVSSLVDGNLRNDDIATVTMPLFHAAQQHCFSGPHVYLGATQVIFPGFDPKTELDTIEREKVNFTFLLPGQYRAMLDVPGFENYDLSSLRMCVYAMAPVSNAELNMFMQKFKPQSGFEIYFGQTEMSPVTTILNPTEHAFKAGSVGKAVLNVEVAIMDDDGKILPPETIGEIVYRGGHTMKGYFNDEEKTASAFQFGWFHSGDLGRMDEEGYIWFEDRKKDMIKTGGENVASLEVEKCLYDYPDVQEVAVVGIPDDRWIERIAALIVPKPGAELDSADIINFCKSKLAGYKVPKQVKIVNEMPKTATGKVRKNIIRESFR